VIPVNPKWPAVIGDLRRRGLRDKDMLDAMADQGVVVHHSALWALRTGRVENPSYALGAALMNLYAGRKP
jgi:hypothetical protein